MNDQSPQKPRDSERAWLEAAYEMLTESGVDAVKVMPLAKRLGLARTGFYWHFKDRDALLEAMIERWEDKNTGNLVRQTEAYAESIAEAVFNLFDCWIDPELFDSRLDLAIRNWAHHDPALRARLNRADQRRQEAIEAMFRRFGYDPEQAEVRTMTMLYTQIGYIAMEVNEELEPRVARMPAYIKVFTGQLPTESEINRFRARHGLSAF